MEEKAKVVLGQYKGLTMKVQPVELKGFEVDSHIEELLERASRERSITDRPVQNGDTISLDFAGYVDGVQFDGGTAQNYTLVIGSHSFIDNFEDQLVGAEIGEKIDVNVRFPENYGSRELAGKPALFVCGVNAITERVTPEFTDDFCREFLGCETTGEYRKLAEERILAERRAKMEEASVQTLLARVVESSQVELAEEMIRAQVTDGVNDFANQLMQQGMELSDYCQQTGLTVEKMEESLRPGVVNSMKTQSVLYTIAQEEGIEVSEAELNETLERIAAQYRMTVEQLMQNINEEAVFSLRDSILLNKAVEVILENAVRE